MADISVPIAANRALCAVCGKEYEKPALYIPDGDLCEECRKTYPATAYVFCRKCNKVVARVEPGLADCGFMVTPRSTLHVECCPECSPGVGVSVPEEFTAYEKQKGK